MFSSYFSRSPEVFFYFNTLISLIEKIMAAKSARLMALPLSKITKNEIFIKKSFE
jgi:hypothetical protein